MEKIELTDRRSIVRLKDLMVRSRTMMEVYNQISKEPNGKSAFDVKVRSPLTDKPLTYPSIHRWAKILLNLNAIKEKCRVQSDKKGPKILYTSTEKGRQAFNLAKEELRRRFFDSIDKESRDVEGLKGPDILKAALKHFARSSRKTREDNEE